MVKVKYTEGKKKQIKVKGPSFEIKEYYFLEIPKESTTQFKTGEELFHKYIDDKEISMDESMKLYA